MSSIARIYARQERKGRRCPSRRLLMCAILPKPKSLGLPTPEASQKDFAFCSPSHHTTSSSARPFRRFDKNTHPVALLRRDFVLSAKRRRNQVTNKASRSSPRPAPYHSHSADRPAIIAFQQTTARFAPRFRCLCSRCSAALRRDLDEYNIIRTSRCIVGRQPRRRDRPRSHCSRSRRGQPQLSP